MQMPLWIIQPSWLSLSFSPIESFFFLVATSKATFPPYTGGLRSQKKLYRLLSPSREGKGNEDIPTPSCMHVVCMQQVRQDKPIRGQVKRESFFFSSVLSLRTL